MRQNKTYSVTRAGMAPFNLECSEFYQHGEQGGFMFIKQFLRTPDIGDPPDARARYDSVAVAYYSDVVSIELVVDPVGVA